MHFKKFFITLLLSTYTKATLPVSGDITLVQIAMNTLNSVRELNSIVTEQRKFSENFENAYEKVNQGIWKADRTAMWLEDMKQLGTTDIEDLNDFNYSLRTLKTETNFLRNRIMEIQKNENETNQRKNQSETDERNSKRRIATYARETKTSTSPTKAQIETAKNTKDITIELARTNAKLDKLTIEFAKMNLVTQQNEKEKVAKQLKEKRFLEQEDLSILTQEDM